MLDIIEIAHEIVDYKRVLHLMSNSALDAAALRPYNAPEDAQVHVINEAGVYHLRAEWRLREFVEFTIPIGCGWQVDGKADPQNAYCQSQCPLRSSNCMWRRKVLLWALTPDAKVSQQIADAAVTFALRIGQDPEFAFMQRIPPGGEEGAMIGLTMLIAAEWVPGGFAALWSAATR